MLQPLQHQLQHRKMPKIEGLLTNAGFFMVTCCNMMQHQLQHKKLRIIEGFLTSGHLHGDHVATVATDHVATE
ncbi:TVG0121023 [Thermoplasma volcanium GSS1]|uniref:TVG0121023 protein n=1 Tax=Thermoplasma volcanium (strain ATCC 51530 / DSM 4299 / JCM 9571 / NBRC 15438 / GSS1) TaxID=273116 RepID=Q97CI7_THEVO|nr:TVG0121023 [Thermoplasma volcanium GSS1]